jgi:hypothetical protein
MLKTLVYALLLLMGVTGGMFIPAVGAIACVGAYLLNPIVLTDVDFRAQLLTTLALVVSLLLRGGRGLRPVGNEAIPLQALWVFTAIAMLSFLWAEVRPDEALERSIEVAKTVLLTTLLTRAIRTERELSWVLLACIVGVWHAALAHTIGVRLDYVSRVYERDRGVLPDSHGAVLICFVPLILLLAWKGRLHERVICLLALPFVLNSIISTYQRTYFLALVVQTVLLLLQLPKRISIRLLPILALAAGLFVFRFAPEDYWQKMGTIKKPTEEASANSRFAINECSQQMLLDHPFGVGYWNYRYVSPRYLDDDYLTEGTRSAHNSFFSVACETGLQGFAAWSVAFLGTTWMLRRLWKRRGGGPITRLPLLALGLELGLCGWLWGGLTQGDQETDPAYWFVAFAVILARLQPNERLIR